MRRNDIDWLRVLAMLTIFTFHCGRHFDHEDWHVKNAILSNGMDIYIAVLGQWIMPLFFILSALSVASALKVRANRQFLKERMQRLVIPLVFGILVVIAPVQVWIERVTHRQYRGSFLSFYPYYFDGFYAFGGNFAWMGLHLWYLEMLFIFSLICLPLFRFLMLHADGFLDRLGAFAQKPGGILLGCVPLLIMEGIVNLSPHGVGMRSFGGWSPLSYLVVFLTGFIMGTNARFRLACEEQRVSLAVLAVLCTLGGYVLHTRGLLTTAGPPWLYAANVALRSLNSWCWLTAILGMGSRHLNFRNRALAYANEALMPFYILHQTVIVVIGYWLLPWSPGVAVKYAVLAVASFALIMAIYAVLIRRIRLLHILFGMK